VSLAVVLLAVLLVRLFALPGFMPERTESGTITLAICSETGAAPASIAIPIERKSQSHDLQDERHCPFTSAGHLASLDAAPYLAPAQLAPVLPGVSTPRALSVGIHAPLPPSTGPPRSTV